MKIGLYHTTLPTPARKPGGTDIVVHRLANALADAAQDDVIVYTLQDRPADSRYRHVKLFANSPWLISNKLARLLLLPVLLNFVDFGSLDVLHVHGDDWFFLRRPFPVVRTMHGSAKYEAQTATSLKRLLSQRLVFLLEKCSAKLASTLLVVGRQTLADFGHGQLIDNGVDLQAFTPGTKSVTPCILFVGTWEGRKRGKFLHELFVRRIRVECPSAILCMVSDYSEPAEGVQWIDCPSDNTIRKLYCEAWVFALPSRYEGFGIPYIEAMASGTAVVTSANEGSTYLLNSGEFGVIASDETFADEIIDLIRNQTRRENLVRAGLHRSRSFAWDIIAKIHRQIYDDTIQCIYPESARRNDIIL